MIILTNIEHAFKGQKVNFSQYDSLWGFTHLKLNPTGGQMAHLEQKKSTIFKISKKHCFSFLNSWQSRKRPRKKPVSIRPSIRPSMRACVHACVRACMHDPVISGATPQFFLKFCMKLSGLKVRKVTKPKF